MVDIKTEIILPVQVFPDSLACCLRVNLPEARSGWMDPKPLKLNPLVDWQHIM